MTKAAFHTLGCKVNQYETEAMKEQFSLAGYQIVGEEDYADVYIINTCTVTNLADRKSRQYIRRMKKQNPSAVVAVTGCYAQVSPEEVASLPEVDIVTGTGEKSKLLEYVEDYFTNKEKQKHILSYDELITYQDEGMITSMDSRTRAYIKIQEGCDRFCSYCMIPFARGHVRSRKPEDVVEEARNLIDKGFKELVLTGINTALYGTEEGFSFDKMPDEDNVKGIEIIIKRIDSLTGNFRIRLSSLEPTVIDAGDVAKLLKYKKLCHHLHLSVQSGSDDIIRKMNRNYTRKEYLDIVMELKKFDPCYGISTDIICGFPGESEEDFSDSLSMVEDAGFCKVHGFKFSRRKGTAAFDMKDQIPGEVKNSRITRLIETSEKSAEKFLDLCTGTTRKVIFEEIADDTLNETVKKAEGDAFGQTAVTGAAGLEKKIITGYTDNYIKVYALGGTEDLNKIMDVRLVEKYKDGMKGEI